LCRPVTTAAIAVLFALLGNRAQAQVPESYRRLWSDPAVVRRIEQNIEKHRKGDVTITVVGQDGQAIKEASVEVRQQTHEFLFGCNAFVLGQLDTPEKNRKYEEAFVRLFNFATVPFYWEGTEPTQGELRYAEGGRDMWRRPPADRYLAFAARYGLTLKGHPLLWHAYNPSWLPKDAETLKKLYQKRFAEITQRYAKDIKIWDVVNESLCCSKTYPLYTPDRAYVAWAFREVAPLFRPGNLPMINEVNFSNCSVGEKNPYYRQVKQLLAEGVGVKGIGFQFHFFSTDALNKGLASSGYAPQNLLDAYESFAVFKLPLFVTEITIPTVPDNGQAAQAELVGNFYRLWFSAPQMAGITWWNLGDGTAVKGENKALGGLLSFAKVM
jgi:GH35 family endo-1,4-beta-xylanase